MAENTPISDTSLNSESGNLNELHSNLTAIKEQIDTEIALMESVDLNFTVLTYKVYEKQFEFRTKLDRITEEREEVMNNQTLTSSDLSLKMNDFQNCITELETEYEGKLFNLNQQKLECQEQVENLSASLDKNFVRLQEAYSKFTDFIEQQKLTASESETHLLVEKYTPLMQGFEESIQTYGKKQDDGWKIENSETKLMNMLEEQGLRVTKSGLLLTNSGHCLTYDEAHSKGYFQQIEIPYHKLYPYMRRESGAIPSPVSDRLSESTRSSSDISKISSEECKYLKSMVGRPLALALAEIAMKQPRDPIHYLGHFLFRYRYNQEVELVQKEELEALENERAKLAKERWDKFLMEEARRVLYEIIAKTEEIAFQNELKRIEAEMAAMAAEEEEEGIYDDEAKDKFEEALYGPGGNLI